MALESGTLYVVLRYRRTARAGAMWLLALGLAVLAGFRPHSANRPHSARMSLRSAIGQVLGSGLRRYARGGARGPADRVTFLLMHAWGLGGTIRVTLDIAGRLAERHEVEVLSVVRRRDEPSFPVPPGVRITAVDDQRPGRAGPLARLLGRLPSAMLPRGDSHTSRPCTLWTDICLARRLRRIPGGVVIGSRPGLTVLALDVAAPGLKVVAHEHMHLAAHPPGMRRMITTRYPEADALIVLTRADRDAFAAALAGHDVPIAQIPNATRDLGGPAPSLDDRLILAAGRLGNQKGFDLLIDAFAQVNARHPDWQLRICGGGPESRRLQRQIDRRRLRARVTLPGPVAGLGAEMGAASIFVLSSRFEGFPLVLLEAMHKGLAVVSFDCPTGPGEVLENGRNGILVAPQDVRGLARGMLALIEDEELRRRCAAAGERTAAAYRMSEIGPRWDDFIAGLLGGPAGARLTAARCRASATGTGTPASGADATARPAR